MQALKSAKKPPMKTNRLPVVYFSVGLANILLGYLASDSLADFLTKLLLMPLLMLVFLFPASRLTRYHFLMITALVFSWFGDILLDLTAKGELFFLAGLLSFMVTQILYTVLFAVTTGPVRVSASLILLLIPVAVYGILLLGWLYPDLGAMRIPVTVYAMVILTMLAFSLIRAVRGNSAGRYLVLSGALLFVISDSLIAISRFAHPFAFSGVLIMTSYITGQFLIVTGMRLHLSPFSTQSTKRHVEKKASR